TGACDGERRGVLLLERLVRVDREGADAHRVVSVGNQLVGELRADDACSNGDEKLHAGGASGFSVPSPFGVRLRSEKKRVMTMPSRKSPRRGSGWSPRARASASSG